MTPDDWLTAARLDAERRRLPEVAALLPALHAAIARLRAADWNDSMRGTAGPTDNLLVTSDELRVTSTE